MMHTYGNPGPVIPLNVAAAAAGMTRDQLKAALGARAVLVSSVKWGVRPADLEAVSPGSSAGLATVNPSTDAAARNSWVW